MRPVHFSFLFFLNCTLDRRGSKRLQSGDTSSINEGNQLAYTGLIGCVVGIFLIEPLFFSAGFDVEKEEEYQSQKQGE